MFFGCPSRKVKGGVDTEEDALLFSHVGHRANFGSSFERKSSRDLGRHTHPTVTGSCDPPPLFAFSGFLSLSCGGFHDIRNDIEIVTVAGVRAALQVMEKPRRLGAENCRWGDM